MVYLHKITQHLTPFSSITTSSSSSLSALINTTRQLIMIRMTRILKITSVTIPKILHIHKRFPPCFTRDRQCSSSSGTTRQRVPRIYTKTGDKGTSALFTGERRPKDDVVFDALGSTDELSSMIGLSREFVPNGGDNGIIKQLEYIQCVIQDLQSVIATPSKSAKGNQLDKVKWDTNHLVMIEKWTDDMTQELPPLKNFILPSGGKAASTLHVARAICRRAERSVVSLMDLDPDDENLRLVVPFLNRLSSYLFVVARYCCMKDGHEETIYRRPK